MTAHLVHHVTFVALASALIACANDATQSETRTESSAVALTRAETAPRQNAGLRCAEHFSEFDEDDSGGISLEEFLAYPHARANAEAVFRERDSDADGNVTADEFCDGWQGPAADRRVGRGMHGHGMGRRGHGRAMGPHCDEHFDAFDQDGDGQISEEEFFSFPHFRDDVESVFEERDDNDDGTLSRSEFCDSWSAAR